MGAPQLGVVKASFFVPGDPAPQGSKRHVGGGRMIESSAKVAPWRAAVSWHAAGQRVMLLGPVAVTITFRLNRPKSLPKRILHPFRRPDIDKLARAVLDGLTGAVFKDDAQVVHLEVWKVFADDTQPTGAHITVVDL